MKNRLLTFPKGGVHPRASKELTRNLPIETLPVPDEVEIPLRLFGAPCKPLVEKKASVSEGDIIGEVEAGLKGYVHSSVTGTVKTIGSSPHPISIRFRTITIASDPKAAPKTYINTGWKGLTSKEILEKVKRAGVVGIGGAGFPTYLKLSPPPGAKVDTLILNGAECEPYLTVDHRLMLEYPGEIIEGAKIMLFVLGIRECRIGIEINKPDAIEVLRKAAAEASSDGYHIVVAPLKVKYPQGSEKQLIHAITGRKVPASGLPFDVGVIVQNVGTVIAIHNAVALQKPFYERVVTVSGGGIVRPANLWVKIGTKISHIVSYLGGTKPELARIVMGGPMMGFSISTLDIPVTKGTSAVLFLTQEEIDTRPYSHCIRCGWCLEACPMGLSPNEIGIYVEGGRAGDTTQFGLFDCFECGCCAYVCPAKRPLVQFIRLAKMENGKAVGAGSEQKGAGPSTKK